MIRVKDYSGDLVQLEVQISKYIEGGCLAVVLLEPETEDLYTVLSRNIEEAIPFLKENQTLIPIGDEMDDEIIQVLLEAGVLIRTGVQFPYNFYTMELFEVCVEKADSVDFGEDEALAI